MNFQSQLAENGKGERQCKNDEHFGAGQCGEAGLRMSS